MAQSYDPVARLSELISGIGIATLTTISPDGSLHSCPMAAHGVEAPGVLWFLSGSNTDKVEAVKTIQRVNVSFADHIAQRYVSVSGFCELVRDHVIAKGLWRDSYKSWFPGGVDDPNLILMKVDVQQAEYWSATEGRMVQLLGFNKPAIQ
ncbi:MAG: pyridoxamine 5'-phosphate oxidase family protein [Candidatus Korobacteraceae bacterium]